MNLPQLLALKEEGDLNIALHNATIEEAISDLYSIKLSTEGTKSRCETIVKLLKSLKNPPEQYDASY